MKPGQTSLSTLSAFVSRRAMQSYFAAARRQSIRTKESWGFWVIETLLIHEEFAVRELRDLAAAFREANVELRDSAARSIAGQGALTSL